MPANKDAGRENDDLKAKMREALLRKQSNDRGVERVTHDRGRAEAHGPLGGPKMHRRKAGGGGA